MITCLRITVGQGVVRPKFGLLAIWVELLPFLPPASGVTAFLAGRCSLLRVALFLMVAPQ
jgi:hypothetical protein